jgi:hypothetical protein
MLQTIEEGSNVGYKSASNGMQNFIKEDCEISGPHQDNKIISFLCLLDPASS